MITSKQLSVDFFFQASLPKNSKDFLQCMIEQGPLSSIVVCSFANWIIFIDGYRQNSLMSSWINEQSFLLETSINHFKTESVFFHWLKWSSEISFPLIFSMISLLTLPSSFFTGLINWHNEFCQKSGLWSLSVIKAGVLAIHSMWSSRLMSSAMFFASKFIDVSNSGVAFLYVFVMSWRSFYVVVRAFHGYYLFCLWRQKGLVTVLFLEYQFSFEMVYWYFQ